VSVSPDGKRLGTGGEDERVKIWDISFSLKEEQLLCSASNQHSVQVVRWSPDGFFLCTGDSGGLVKLWKRCDGGSGGAGSFDVEAQMNKEHWKAVITFRGHSLDITGLAWSPNGNLVASCSIDNHIRVWEVKKDFRDPRILTTIETESVVILKGHEGWVKNVAWDPVGRYLASVSDDRSVIIWKCNGWNQEAKITEPFNKSLPTTMRRQLSWSPDGCFLVVSHAYDEPRHVGYVIERNKWWDSESAVRLVGHQKPICVCSFSPTLYSSKPKSNSAVVAIACERATLTLWTPGRSRPLVICKNLFKQQVLDMSWSLDGLRLVICSMDGGVASITCESFKENPNVGEPLGRDELEEVLRDFYGEEDVRNADPTITETPEMYRFEQKRKAKQPEMAPNLASQPSNEGPQLSSSSSTSSVTVQQQTETRTFSGKRRIAPISLSAQPLAKASKLDDSLQSSSSTQLGSPLSKRVGQQESNNSNLVLSSEFAKDRVIVVSNEPQPSLRKLVLKGCRRPLSWKFTKVAGGGVLKFESKKLKQGFLQHKSTDAEYETTVYFLSSHGDEFEWSAEFSGRACVAAGNKLFIACATRSKEMYLWHAGSGLLLLPPLQLKSAVASLAVGGSNSPYLACVTCDGRLLLWDLQRLRALLVDVQVDPLFMEDFSPQSRMRLQTIYPPFDHFPTMGVDNSLVETNDDDESDEEEEDDKEDEFEIGKKRGSIAFGITEFGTPLCLVVRTFKFSTKEESAAFAFESGMKSWFRVADAKRFMNSNFFSTLAFPNAKGDRILETLQQAVSENGRQNELQVTSSETRAKALLGFNADFSAGISKQHLESLVTSSLVLKSPDEYKHWLAAYTKRLAMEGDEGRLRTLCGSLASGDGVSQPSALLGLLAEEDELEALRKASRTRVLGLDKKSLLSEVVIPAIASNKHLQNLVVEFQ